MKSPSDNKSTEEFITHTSNWIKKVVIACNFCPFAAKALAKKSVRYIVIETTDFKTALTSLANEFEFLNYNENIETTFIIFSEGFADFFTIFRPSR